LKRYIYFIAATMSNHDHSLDRDRIGYGAPAGERLQLVCSSNFKTNTVERTALILCGSNFGFALVSMCKVDQLT
jgi:hypothetical protein